MGGRGDSYKNLVSFNAGELSPLLDARVDLGKYQSGCRTLQNFQVMKHGGVKRRPGTQYISEVKTSANKTRIIPFNFSTDTAYVLELGNQYMRFYTSGAQISFDTITAWATSTSYSVTDLVSNGGSTYKCIVAHTSASGDEPGVGANWQTYWRLFDWADATEYVEGDQVKSSDGNYYVCIAAHTSEALATLGSDDGAGDNEPGIGTDSADYWQQTNSLSVLEIPTPWETADLFDIHFAQINDVMYMTHPDYTVRKLNRWANDTWSLVEVEFAKPAFLDENITDVTITPSATTGTGITLTASSDTFDLSSHVGSYWQISHPRSTSEIVLSLNTGSDTNSSSIRFVGDYEFTTETAVSGGSVWDGTLKIQRSDDDSTWETLHTFNGNGDRHINFSGTQSGKAAYYRVRYEPDTAKVSVAYLRPTGNFANGLVKITAVSSATSATADVIEEMDATDATKYWSEGAWSDKRGYPRAVALYGERLCFAGTSYQPQTIWGSQLDDYENFLVGTNDDDAYNFTLAAQEFNEIRWMVPTRQLIIGTSGGEWSLRSGDSTKVVAPTNVVVERESTYGSTSVAAKQVNEAVMFVQRQGRKVRELVYSFEQDQRIAPDMTLLSEHVTSGGITQMDFQQQPDAILWAVNGDGELIGLTYERHEQVVGWHVHTTGGTAASIESVAVIYGSGDDEVWIIAKRTINGGTKRYIERLNPTVWSDVEDAFYVDSGITYDSTATTTITGLDHLEGETVKVFADGAVQDDKTVSSGSITIDSASVVQVGLSYTSTLKPMRLDMDGGMGVTQSQIKRIREVFLRLYQTLGYTVDAGVAKDKTFTSLTTDEERVTPPGADYDEDATITVSTDEPIPLSILGIVVKYEVTGK